MTAILQFRSITCFGSSERFGDELYVTFKGTKRSLPNMTTGQTEDLGDEFLFNGSQTLSLFENDGDHWYDRDDFIGKYTIDESPAELTLNFDGDHDHHTSGAHYQLKASITPGP
jgi:hypothetical protein